MEIAKAWYFNRQFIWASYKSTDYRLKTMASVSLLYNRLPKPLKIDLADIGHRNGISLPRPALLKPQVEDPKQVYNAKQIEWLKTE